MGAKVAEYNIFFLLLQTNANAFGNILKLGEKYFTLKQFQSFLWGWLRWLFQSPSLPWLNEKFAIVVSKERYLKPFSLYFIIPIPSE